MKKRLLLLVVMFLTAIIIAACGNEDEGEPEETVDAAEEEEATTEEEKVEEPEEEAEEAEEEVDAEETSASGNDGDFADLITYMEDETEGTAAVLYENNEAQTHEMEGVTVSLDGYSLVELLDFHRDYSIPFDDQNNGAVLIAQYTIENTTDEDLHYMTTYDLSYVNSEKFLTNHRYLLPEENQLPNILSPSNDYLLEAGEEIVGYYSYAIGEDRLAEILDLGSVDIAISTPQTDPDDFASTIGSEGRFTLPLDAENAEKEADKASQGFYEDKVTADNMGDKEMLEEEQDIGESQELGDVGITLVGYQFTNFVPNAEEAPRFQEDEVVLLTVKFDIENGYDEDLAKNSISSTLHVNDGKQWTLNEGMLLPYTNSDTIPSGDSGELLQVFLLDQEQYEAIWKDKSFEMELGPMRNEDGEDISKGEKAEFKLK